MYGHINSANPCMFFPHHISEIFLHFSSPLPYMINALPQVYKLVVSPSSMILYTFPIHVHRIYIFCICCLILASSEHYPGGVSTYEIFDNMLPENLTYLTVLTEFQIQ